MVYNSHYLKIVYFYISCKSYCHIGDYVDVLNNLCLEQEGVFVG